MLGAHAQIAAQCLECHANGYQNTPNTCVGCHIEDFNATTDPNHQQAGFPQDCAQCHNQNTWEGATFDHYSVYPLLGAHAQIAAQCLECHANGYQNTPNTCVGCHLEDFNATTDPNHQQAGFPQDCAQCHSQNNWEGATFDHNTVYPLLGAHAQIAAQCLECHANGYQNTPNTCVGCHIENFNSTTDPNHQQAGFPQDCAQCHSQNTWDGATFDHNTVYPLIGAHAQIAAQCLKCHANGYQNTPNTCVGCHLEDFNATTDPNHQQAGFPQDCAQCHSQNNWEGATFDHNTVYPLLGAHAQIAAQCLECHANGYQNTPNTCVGCHITDYNNARDPNHRTEGFPTDCQDCHSPSSWTPSTFNHDAQYFPIYSGRHNGEWNVCNDCHIAGSNFQQFSCIQCHEHSNKSKVDKDHKDERNYSYTPTSCYECHPRGRS